MKPGKNELEKTTPMHVKDEAGRKKLSVAIERQQDAIPQAARKKRGAVDANEKSKGGGDFIYQGPVRRTAVSSADAPGFPRIVPRKPVNNASSEPVDAELLNAKHKVTVNHPHNHALVKAKAEAGEYEFEAALAKGAESMLFTGQCGGETVVIKSIRSKWNRWLGGAHTRRQEVKLVNVKYSTKTRHIQNEFKTGEVLYNDMEMPVVHIYALRRHTKFFFELGYDLIMEYLPGKDLSDQQMIQQLSLQEKISICLQAFKALNCLHRKKLVHMDIKPSNFMYNQGVLKIFDFGISTFSGAKPTSLIGTAGYLSPEQIAKETVNEATDLFALGITLGTLFGGHPLPQKLDELRTRSAKANAKYELENNSDAALTLLPDLEDMPGFFDILRRCTVYKRSARTQTCQAVMYQLKAWSKTPECTMDIQVDW